MRLIRFLVAAGILVICLVPSPSYGADGPDIASGDVTLHPSVGDFKRLVPGDGAEYSDVTATLLLRNSSSKPARVKLDAVLDDGTTVTIRRVQGKDINLESTKHGDNAEELDNGGVFTLAPGITTLRTTFAHLTRSDAISGRLVLSGPDVSAPSLVKLTIDRPTPAWYIWVPLGLGLLLAIALIILRWLTLGTTSGDLPAAPSWSFKDGWASNLVLVGAVVTAVLAAVSSLGPDPFGDFALSQFVGLNLIFGALVVTAPLTYAAFSTRRTVSGVSTVVVTTRGFLLAANATLWAAFGQLLSLFILVRAASHTPGQLLTLGALLVVAAAVVAIYAWKTIAWTIASGTTATTTLI